MTDYLVKFNDYTFPSTLLPVDEAGGQNASEAELIRQPGAAILSPVVQPRNLSIRGQIAASTPTAWFALRDALLRGTIDQLGTLWYGRNDRYYKDAYVQSYGISDPVEGRLWGMIGTVSFTFRAAAYPNAFGTTTYSTTLNASVLNTKAADQTVYTLAQGDAPTLPVWTITIGSAGAGPMLFQSSSTDAQGKLHTDRCILRKPDGSNFLAGDVIVLDRLTGVATLNGVAVLGLYDRRIPRLWPGTNQILCYSLATSGGATLAECKSTYPGRYR